MPGHEHQVWGGVDLSFQNSSGSFRSQSRFDGVLIHSRDSSLPSLSIEKVQSDVQRALVKSSAAAEEAPLDEDGGDDDDQDQDGQDDQDDDQYQDGGNAGDRPGVGTPSVGSANHDTGGCRPCAYVTRKKGCVHAANCTFCHLEHAPNPRGRQRPCKWERRARRAALLSIWAADEENGDTPGQDGQGHGEGGTKMSL
eukprot:TRINITY_DN51701_c0_g1_i1.p1 TRINITY_DN51701_c0_g1~~TRINITY_DN51701_c0_g1_i1.p1  ORF type:complete len:213 (+),score=34.61 TRINITY_DN51701_c0_g1_i1:51-641(+)